ncbi:MAG TPA: FAD-dependent oxidoreductase, partial [Lachnospiraceae bacterium]|nr:FAD-dependent oxidoreductase [Lachnospiraceae bacterium]
LDVDTICIAAGLTPAVELAFGAGCRSVNSPVLGGLVPWHDETMRTSLSSIYIAGDVSGVEEASTAMEEGRMAGLSAAQSLGYLQEKRYRTRFEAINHNLLALRSGMFGQKRRDAKKAIVAASKG